MKVLVLGATGPTGRLVVERALEDGHTVTGFTRHPASLDGKHQRLRPHAGDVLDPDAVLRAVEGHDAVISVFGVPYDPFRAIEAYSKGTRNVVQAMQEHAVERYVGVTSGGTSTAPQPGSSAFFEWIIKPVFGRTTYADQRRQEEIVMRSSSRWTIAGLVGLSMRRRREATVWSRDTWCRVNTRPRGRTSPSSWSERSLTRSWNTRPLPSPALEHNAQARPTQCVLRPPDSPSQPDSE